MIVYVLLVKYTMTYRGTGENVENSADANK